MSDLKSLAYEAARNFRDKLELGNYCAKQLLEIIDKLQVTENVSIKTIRTSFENLDLSGFIGYKKGTFVIVTNTNHKLGSERFTIAHEIYHLIANRTLIKKNSVLEEMECYDNSDTTEIMANAFAAELLMPEDDMIKNVKLITGNMTKKIDESVVVQLYQKYGVSYIAITKRLNEIKLIDQKQETELEKFESNSEGLNKLTKNLGYTNELNLPSKDTYLNTRDLQNIRVNYENGDTTYDDLVRIFSYLGCEPEKFGYEEDIEISDEAAEFMKALS